MVAKKDQAAKKRASAELSQPLLAKPADHIPEGSLAALRRQASDCKACPLWRNATQTVFGAGASRAVAMRSANNPGRRKIWRENRSLVRPENCFAPHWLPQGRIFATCT